jgi:AraC-like DNA-binding protein
VAATRADHEFSRTTSLVELACNLMLADPSMDRVALGQALDVSGAYLSRRFQSDLATTLQEQRIRIRLALFVTRVMRDGRSFLNAALDAGFGSYSQLHRVFVRLAGVTPRAYFADGGRNHRAHMQPEVTKYEDRPGQGG